MFERESLQAGEFAEGHAAATVGMDHAGARCGHAARELVPVLGVPVLRARSVDVVLRPTWRDVADGVIDSCPGFETGTDGVGGVRGFGELGEGFAGAVGREGRFVSFSLCCNAWKARRVGWGFTRMQS